MDCTYFCAAFLIFMPISSTRLASAVPVTTLFSRKKVEYCWKADGNNCEFETKFKVFFPYFSSTISENSEQKITKFCCAGQHVLLSEIVQK